MKSFMRPLLLTTVLTVMALPVQAAPFTYEPEHCEFKITFPEKPYIEQKCTSGDQKSCTEVVTFTKVVAAESSVNFRVTCIAPDAKSIAAQTDDTLKEAVKQMVSQASLTTEDVQVATKADYKSAATVSVGTHGERDIIYTAQVWLGKKSLLSLEGDMSGPQDPKADQLFTEVLKSMKPKAAPAKEAESPAKAE